MSIKPGTKAALIGPSGIGQLTLLKLFRLYDQVIKAIHVYLEHFHASKQGSAYRANVVPLLSPSET